MTRNSGAEWEDQLRQHLAGSVGDIIHDELPPRLHNRSFRIETVSVDTDDGAAYGRFDIVFDEDSLRIRVGVSGWFQGERDRWSWSSESHYTQTVHYDELQDVELEILERHLGSEQALDKAIDADIDSAEHETGGC